MDNWIANAIGKMHINDIKQDEVASKMRIRRDYLNKILNGKKTPKDAETRIMSAIDEIILEKQSAS